MEDIKRFKAAVAAFDTELDKMSKATTPMRISDSERILNRIIKEIQVLAPRLNNGAISASRRRRQEIARGE